MCDYTDVYLKNKWTESLSAEILAGHKQVIVIRYWGIMVMAIQQSRSD